MDPLLKGKYFNFFVDEIFLADMKRKMFGAIIVPDIKSVYFPPMHLRTLYFGPEFLTLDMYVSFRNKIPELQEYEENYFQSSVLQGGYYSISTDEFPGGLIFKNRLPDYFHETIFKGLTKNPYNDSADDEEIISFEVGMGLLDDKHNHNHDNKLNLYCFNVGQGDSFLLIFPNDNVYIVDTNIYSGSNLYKFINDVKSILKQHNLNTQKVKGLIITHKHVDHIRGASKLLESQEFNVEYFLMNFDYIHGSRVVKHLLDTANIYVKKRININQPGVFHEGLVDVIINNPYNLTNNNFDCKDINDSSISLHIKYGKSTVLLTGDLGNNYLNSNTDFSLFEKDRLLKVSHHGSRTGTNVDLLNKIEPKFAFISAGNHKGFKHPHSCVMNMLKDKDIDIDVSRDIKQTVVYSISTEAINRY